MKVSGQPGLLSLHQARIQKTLGQPGLNLEELFSTLTLPSPGLLKVRVNYNNDGHVLSCDIASYSPRLVRRLALIECPDLVYGVKSTDRSALEQAWRRGGEADDVIITQDGFLTDTSYSISFLATAVTG